MKYRVRQLVFNNEDLLYDNLSDQFYSLSEAEEFINYARNLDKTFLSDYIVRYTIVEVK